MQPTPIREVYFIVRAIPQQPGCKTFDIGIWHDPERPIGEVLDAAASRLEVIQGRGFGPDRQRSAVDCDYLLVIVPSTGAGR